MYLPHYKIYLSSFHQWYYYDREDNKNRQKNSRNDILWTKKRFEKCQNDRQRLRILKQMEKLVDAQVSDKFLRFFIDIIIR